MPMKCYITGQETKSKWRNIPLCRNAMIQAKLFMKEDPKLSVKEALIKVDTLFQEIVDKRVNETIHQETLNLIK